jgi:hypothetical protein
MILDYLQLPIGLVCLVVPSTILCSSKVREKLRKPIRREEEGLGSLLRCPTNWIDLIRGAVGAWLIQRVFQNVPAGQDDLATTYMIAQMAVLTLGIVAQIIWIGRPLQIVGPVFFLAGLTLVVSGPAVGGFALALGFASALMFKRLSIGFYAMPVSLVAFGMLFHQFSLLGLLNACAFVLPVFLVFVFRTRIAYARRPAPARVKPLEIPAEAPAENEGATVLRPDFTTAPIISMPKAMRAEYVSYESVPEPVPLVPAPVARTSERRSRALRQKLFAHGGR